MMSLPDFKNNEKLTIGIELELQLIDLNRYNLTMESDDLLRRLNYLEIKNAIKPEITLSMIELNSSVHENHTTLTEEMNDIRSVLIEACRKSHIGICGGGTHPFQKWKKQRIFPNERFMDISEQYGFLAKQFSVFGQHIHVGCPNGNDALYLCHALARYIPQFIALSASSPFYLGVDSLFDCARLAAISAFPLSGTPPFIHTWSEFEYYFARLEAVGVVKSMKDFYWDIRPKPEFGTIELRICDTPLTIDKAVSLASYAQTLVRYLLSERPPINKDVYLTYFVNKFRASRYGLNALFIDTAINKEFSLAEDIQETCVALMPYSENPDNMNVLTKIKRLAMTKRNDAHWIRDRYTGPESLDDIVRSQTHLWMGGEP